MCVESKVSGLMNWTETDHRAAADLTPCTQPHKKVIAKNIEKMSHSRPNVLGIWSRRNIWRDLNKLQSEIQGP